MPKIDLSLQERTITARVEPLIAKMGTLSLDEIKKEFSAILNDPTTYASDITRNKWKNSIRDATHKNKLMFTITNLYLAGSNLSANLEKEKQGPKSQKEPSTED